MGKFAPVFLAFLLNCFGVNIFKENTPGCEPLLSSLIFLLAVFMLLWQLRLYPSSLRKLSRQSLFMIEFFLSAFIMEHVMTDFWYPLESSVAAFLPKVSQFEAEILKQGGWDCGGIFAFLQWDGTLVMASYVMSFFFLFTALHSTRIIDFRLLKCGFTVFVKDIFSRIKKFKKRLMKSIFSSKKTCPGRKLVKTSMPYPSSDNPSGCDDSEDDDACFRGEDDVDEYTYCTQKSF